MAVYTVSPLPPTPAAGVESSQPLWGAFRHRHPPRLALSDEHHQLLAPGDAGANQVALQQHVGIGDDMAAYVGTEHIVLGLLRKGDGVAARVLKDLGVDIERTRIEILKELGPNFGSPGDQSQAH